MKTQKIIITKDRIGRICFWPFDLNKELYLSQKGEWLAESGADPEGIVHPSCCWVNWRKMLGFVLHKNTKRIIEVRTK